MKIMTILGTRPEIIRLSVIIPLLDRYADSHVLVHTGQNFTASLSGIFFEELGLRAPDYVLQEKQAGIGGQLAAMFGGLEPILLKERPDRVLLLGDTNSALCAILAERMGIPVIHMEAGNRCYDLNVPEEKNRRVIDAVSTINMPYTPQSKRHLAAEGIPNSRIMLSGNPIHEVMTHYAPQIAASDILNRLSLAPGQYFLVTVHRAENVDHKEPLMEIMQGLNLIAEHFGIRLICSIHPRTRSKLSNSFPLQMHSLVEFYEPFGFFDFVALEKNARCAITDSGTVQEECCLLGVPTVTIRRTTERPETVDCGSNVVSGVDSESILRCARLMTSMSREWEVPDGYLDSDVSHKIVKFLLGGNLYVQ
ncbi:non-hydrolyzing UDP-N-acetylglucosamine 2-epimerase [Paenibacillus durus]|uniref:UDP-N-acetylglucosamine 2-epimerase n=1 Tax=Paenibacillus durus ATCC 35681 TaxID=1333534 RepID=A0A0F7FBA7_PAEDU|nr:UDP-N-acetylglucosamine 2-epimerase (non-hydrolyzing) [Paenibacillus durus]AKG35964.1 UDP-N-acetylglucosamine 2-epimerase [Paenibacillus durus ATCC 35681]